VRRPDWAKRKEAEWVYGFCRLIQRRLKSRAAWWKFAIVSDATLDQSRFQQTIRWISAGESLLEAPMAHIVLINPKFEISFWGLEHALPLIGKRANMPVAALPLIAALTPDKHNVTIIDENVEPIDFDLCARADIVGVTGMIVQRKRIREILTELCRRGVFTVVGGPWVSVNEAWYDNLADVLFVGEAEETWPQFLSEWEQDGYDYGAAAAPRTSEDGTLRLRLGAILARLPVYLRFL
jgi:hypothetical protein